MNPVEIITHQGGVQADPGCEGFEGENPGSGQMTQWWHFVESDLRTDTVVFQRAMVDQVSKKVFSCRLSTRRSLDPGTTYFLFLPFHH